MILLTRLGFVIIHRYIEQQLWPANLILEPIFLGGVMGLSKNTPPGMNPSKGKYMMQDLKKCSQFFDIPVKMPKSFPANSLFAQRILTALKLDHPHHLKSASLALWKAYWQEDRDLEVNTIEEYLKPILKDNFEGIVEQASTERIKSELTKQTNHVAQVEGAFGAPWFVVEVDGKKTTFFGSDRFESMAYWAGFPYQGPNPKASRL
jgi:glutathione S-transferase kappa 1